LQEVNKESQYVAVDQENSEITLESVRQSSRRALMPQSISQGSSRISSSRLSFSVRFDVPTGFDVTYTAAAEPHTSIALGAGLATSIALGGGLATPKGQTLTFFFFLSLSLALWGWPNHPQGPWQWFDFLFFFHFLMLLFYKFFLMHWTSVSF